MPIKNTLFSASLCALLMGAMPWGAAAQEETPAPEVAVQPVQPLSLSEAIQADDVDAVKIAIANGDDVSGQLENGSYPIILAAQYATSEMMELLTAYDVRFSVTDAAGRNPLHYLAERGLKDGIQLILILDDSLMDAPDAQGITPLYAAYLAKQNAVARFLIQQGANIHTKTKDETPLAFVAMQQVDNPQLVQDLIKYRFNLFQRINGQNLAEVATQAGQVQSAKLLQDEVERTLKQFQKDRK